MIRYLILGLLRDGKPRHGYAMMKEYRDASGLQMSIGNFYREAARLVTDGMVRTAPNPPDADKRRLPYQITDRGIAALDAWLALPEVTASADYQDELGLRVFVAGHGGSTLALEVLEGWRQELLFRQTVLQRVAAPVVQAEAADRAATLRALLLRRRLSYVRTDLDLLEAFRGMRTPASNDAPSRRDAVPAGRRQQRQPQQRRATA